MSQRQPDFLLANNAVYVAKGDVPKVDLEKMFVPKGEKPKNDDLRCAVVTCMDPRIDPLRALGLEGNAAMIRNAGGVGVEALRSLIIFQEFCQGKDIAVVHHTGCGMLYVSPDAIHAGPTNIPADMQFYEFSDVEEGLRRDVRWLRERVQEGVLLEGTRVVGYILENETGKLQVVE
ncbi:carbonic anhydrase [Peniophora sp. CONT]|nr:carbonic anhydrase [Peniophora sp. CONT]